MVCAGTVSTGAEQQWSVLAATGNIPNMAANTALLLIRGSGASMGERRKEERSTGAVAWSGLASGTTIDPPPQIVHTGQICITVVRIRGVRGFFYMCQDVEFFAVIKIVTENLSQLGFPPGALWATCGNPSFARLTQHKDSIKYARPVASKCRTCLDQRNGSHTHTDSLAYHVRINNLDIR